MVKVSGNEEVTEYIGVAWNGKMKDGSTFISLKINKEVTNIPKDLVMFPNKRKRDGKKDPDWNVVKSKPKKD